MKTTETTEAPLRVQITPGSLFATGAVLYRLWDAIEGNVEAENLANSRRVFFTFAQLLEQDARAVLPGGKPGKPVIARDEPKPVTLTRTVAESFFVQLFKPCARQPAETLPFVTLPAALDAAKKRTRRGAYHGWIYAQVGDLAIRVGLVEEGKLTF